MLDLTEPNAIDPGLLTKLPNTSCRHCNSTASPTEVEVPWPSIREAVAGEMPAFSQALFTASLCPTGLGAVMVLSFAVAGASEAPDHGVDLIPIPLGVFQAFEDKDSGAFAHDEPVRAFGVGAGACAGQRAYFTEFHKVVGLILASTPPVMTTS